MQIDEKSSVKLVVDGVVVDEDFHDANDAWQKAINKILEGKQQAVITEVVTIKKA